MRKMAKRTWEVRFNHFPAWGCSVCGHPAKFVFEGALESTMKYRDAIYRTSRCEKHSIALAQKHGLMLPLPKAAGETHQ